MHDAWSQRPVVKRNALLAMAATLLLALLFSPPSLAASSHPFNSRLSLTGDCSVSSVDEIADPGLCPIPPGTRFGEASEPDHPSGRFRLPHDVATDAYGDIYVDNGPFGSPGITEGRIDIFSPDGFFITEIPNLYNSQDIAVDSNGVLYLSKGSGNRLISRYKPSLYEPQVGKIEYGLPPEVVLEEPSFANFIALAVNPADDHLFAETGSEILEFKSAADGNEPLPPIGVGVIHNGDTGLAIDSSHGRIYASDWKEGDEESRIAVMELGAPHNVLRYIEGVTTPTGEFFGTTLGVAVDEGTGHVFVFDPIVAKVYEFGENGEYLDTIEHEIEGRFGATIGVDNGPHSPNGAESSEGRFLFVPSGSSNSHIFAFGPSTVNTPAIEATSVSGVSATEAVLHAAINPSGLPTTYSIQYTTRQRFEAEGFSAAAVAGEGQLAAGDTGKAVLAGLSGLTPGTAYRFRVIATNEAGGDEAVSDFATYPESETFGGCPNEPLRSGLSSLLPDCRAYELVSPPDTNGQKPYGEGFVGGAHFTTRRSSPAGDRVTFHIEGGLIPGSNGTGALGGDPYLATRGSDGWKTAQAGPTGAETMGLSPGSSSPDQGYSFWETSTAGSAAIGENFSSYVRYPDGHSALVGRGSLGTDPEASGNLISEGGSHIVFSTTTIEGHTPQQLEPKAPVDGTTAVYDRTADEVTHVVSLLPGNITPGGDSSYVGASLDGRGIAFRLGGTLYLRYNNQATYAIGGAATFAGIAEGGSRVFYLEGGNLYAFDALSNHTISFSTSGNIVPVNVSRDGTTAYFVSPSKLTNLPNPVGVKAKAGQQNLYLSREGQLSFVATLTELDVKGVSNGQAEVEGLGLWTHVAGSGQLAADPSRLTSNGNVLLFESRAALTGYDPEGHSEVYRYDAPGNSLQCLSCNPTGIAASSGAHLESISSGLAEPEPLRTFDLVNNLSTDGRRAFFQSDEALVPGDVDGLQDVYEWEAQGVGSCSHSGGCIYLISSGHSFHPDYIFGASDSGEDVFFRTADQLLPLDTEATPSIYDAKIGGGFPEPVEEACEGEGCRPTLLPAPVFAAPGSEPGESGNVRRRCPKGKVRVKRHGRAGCAKKHHRRHHRRSAAKKGGRQ